MLAESTHMRYQDQCLHALGVNTFIQRDLEVKGGRVIREASERVRRRRRMVRRRRGCRVEGSTSYCVRVLWLDYWMIGSVLS